MLVLSITEQCVHEIRLRQERGEVNLFALCSRSELIQALHSDDFKVYLGFLHVYLFSLRPG